MDIKFTVQVPEECRKWILLQRPGCERFISSGNFDIMYSNGLWEDYHGLLPYLPDKVASILDIGCGVAGIDVLLYHHYQNPEIHLMDGDGLGDNKIWVFRQN